MSELFASVLYLDRQAIAALNVKDPYAVHRVVYSLFDRATAALPQQSSGILYADQGGDFQERRILLLSQRQPAETAEGRGRVETKVVPADFLQYPRYRFQVVINPTRRSSQSRNLIPLKTRAEITDWFCQRAERQWGFRVHPASFVIDDVQVQSFSAKQNHQITLAQAKLRGELEVIDASCFQQAFRQGIGRARAFGCGLLQMNPHQVF